MRNLKKILALVLALVMSFSVMTVSSAAFKDQDKIDETYAEAADVLNALKVFEGYENGNFDPKGLITRAEVAAIIYRVATGDVDKRQVAMYADMNAFTDVKADDWFAGYVNYCASAKYIKGRGDGTFDPQGKVTGFEAMAMILRAIGYDRNNEFTGEAYTVEVAKVAQTRGITKNLKNVTLGASASREVVAEILFQTIIIPQVSYSTINQDYTIYKNHLQSTTNNTLAYDNFRMVKLNGVIDAVGRLAGTTTLSVDSYDNKAITVVVNNTTTSWEKIGYEAHIYATETGKVNVYDAVTEAYIDGTSMLVSTDGTPFDYLSTYVVPMDTKAEGAYDNYDGKYDVYYNGVLVTGADATAAKNAVSRTGVKVDFIDNDNAGKCDAVVITEYTLATVTGVATDINAGLNATIYNSYYLNGIPFKTKNVVCDEALTVGEYLTYVKYNGDAYVTKLAYAQGTFETLHRGAVDLTGAMDYMYTIDGEDYVKAAQYVSSMDVLYKANLNETVVIALDQYGYMLFSYIPVDAATYLYVFENEQTKGMGANRMTETLAVFTDGTVESINVAYVVDEAGNKDYFFKHTSDETIAEETCIGRRVYQYVEKDGVYYLFETSDFVLVTAEKYTSGKAQFGRNGLNNNSTLVDVRNSKVLGTVYVGHTNDNRVPSLNDAYTLSLVDANGIIAVGFLIAGYEPYTVDYSNEFIVYDTGYNRVVVDVYGDEWYYLSVIVDNAIVEVALSETEYKMVDTYGVGHYVIAKNGALTYTAFPEAWYDVAWGANTLTLLGLNKYIRYDEIPFYVLNIYNGTAQQYIMTAGVDYEQIFGTNVKAYITYDEKGNIAAIYLFSEYDETADQAGRYTTVTQQKGEFSFEYAVADGYITVPTTVVDNTELVEAMEDYYDAVEDYEKAVKALEKYMAAMTAAEEEEEDNLTTLTNAVWAAWDAVVDAYNAVVALLEELEADEVFVADSVIAEIEACYDEMTEMDEALEELDKEVLETVKDELMTTENIAAFAEALAAIETIDVVYNVGADVNAVVLNAIDEAVEALEAFDVFAAEGGYAYVEFVEADLAASNTVTVKVRVVVGGWAWGFEHTLTVNATEAAEVPAE